MTIDELIARLEDYRDEIGGDAEVRLMTQQNWPFENSIYGLASGAESTIRRRRRGWGGDDAERRRCGSFSSSKASSSGTEPSALGKWPAITKRLDASRSSPRNGRGLFACFGNL